MSRKKSLPRRARKRSHGAESWPRHLRGVAYSTSKVKVTPFLGLTQTCKSICNEYRQWYLSQSPVSICDIQMYFYAFVEDPKLNWKKAFDIFQQTLRSIKIVLSRCGNVDMIPLLRLKARHTSINIEMGSSGSEHRSQNAPSKQVNEDKNEKWLHWINKGTMKHARLVVQDAELFSRTRAKVCIYVVLRRWDAEMGC
jgi:hypothetical protein